MSRFHIAQTVYDTEGVPLAGATVSVCVLGSTELSREPLYVDANSATRLANPLTSDGNGLVDFYLAYPLVCDLRPVKDGVAGRTATVYPGRPTVGDVLTWDGVEDVHKATGLVLLGPYAVTFESSGIGGDGHVLETGLAAGTVIIRAWAMVQTAFSGGTVGDIRVVAGDFSGNDFDNVYRGDAKDAPWGPAAAIAYESQWADGFEPSRRALVFNVPGDLRVQVATDSTLVAGVALVYALVWRPV